jgi:hypothetical protein
VFVLEYEDDDINWAGIKDEMLRQCWSEQLRDRILDCLRFLTNRIPLSTVAPRGSQARNARRAYKPRAGKAALRAGQIQ